MPLNHVLRNVRDNLGRTLLIVISITISAAVVFLNLTISADIVEQYALAQKSIYHEYNLLVTGNGQRFDIDALEYDSADVASSLEVCAAGVVDAHDAKRAYKLYGVDTAQAFDAQFIVADNEVELARGEGIVGREMARERGIEVGDKIEYTTVKGTEQITVSALAKDEGLFATARSIPLVVTAPETVRDRFDIDQSEVSAVFLSVTDDERVDEVANQIEDADASLTATDLVNSDELKSNLGTIGSILLVILIIVFLLNFYIISSNSKVILEGRTASMGTFRSIGATKLQVAVALLVENVLYGLVGGVLGCMFGLVLRQPLSDAFSARGPAASTGVDASLLPAFAITLGAAVALQIVCVLAQIVKESRRPILSMLIDKPATPGMVSAPRAGLGALMLAGSIACHFANQNYHLIIAGLGYFLAIVGAILLVPAVVQVLSGLLSRTLGAVAPAPVHLGMRNIATSKPAAANAVLVCVALSIMASVYLLSSGLGSMLADASDEFDCDVRVTGMTQPADEYEKALDDSGVVSSTDPIYFSTGKIEVAGADAPLVVFGTDMETQGVYELSGKTLSDLDDDEALIDAYYAMRIGLSIGDELVVSGDTFADERLVQTVAGFVDASKFSSMRNVAIITPDRYKRSVSEVPAVLNVTVDEDPADAKDILIASLADFDLGIQTVDEYIGFQQSYTGSIVNMVWIILWLSIGLAVIGVINNLVLSFMQRKREYAVLNSVAMSQGDLVAMIASELFCMFVLSCALGVIAASWLCVLLSDLLYSIGLYLTAHVDVPSMLVLALIAFVALMLTTLVPVRALRRMDLVQELKCV